MPYLLLHYITNNEDFTDSYSVPVIINTTHIGHIEKADDGRANITMIYGRKYSIEETFEHLLDILNVPF